MPNSDKVRVVVNGSASEYEYWTEISITSELNTVARSFQIGTTAKLPQSADLLTAFKVGDEVQVYIGNDLVLTGYIDATPISYDGTNVTAAVIGRSRTEDIIDCSPAPTGYDFSATMNSQKWSATRSVGDFVEPEITIAANQFKDVPLKQAVAQLIAPYGIHLICELDNDIVNGNISQTIKDDDTILKALQNLVGTTGLYFIDDEFGNLKIVNEEKRSHNLASLSLGKNILVASAQFDGSKLFQQYRMLSSQKGTGTQTGKNLQSYTDSADSDISRFRYLCKTDQKQNGNASSSKKSEAKYRRGQFYKTSYTVVGWRQFDGGELWKANTLVTIQDDILNNSQEMLITKVTYTLSSAGMLTTLDCIPPAGFKPDQQTQQQDKAVVASSGSNNSKWASVDNGLDLVGKDNQTVTVNT